LNIDTAGFDAVLIELFLDVFKSFFLDLLPGFDEADGRHALQFVAKMVTDGCLKDFVDEIYHRTDHGNHARRVGIRDVNLHLQVYFEHKSFVTFGDDLRELRIEIVRLGDGIGPIEGEDGGRDDFRLIAARVERIFSGAQRFFSNTAVPRSHQ
jgi:hypothetical protein